MLVCLVVGCDEAARDGSSVGPVDGALEAGGADLDGSRVADGARGNDGSPEAQDSAGDSETAVDADEVADQASTDGCTGRPLYLDQDGDGFGDPADRVEVDDCEDRPGRVERAGDCNDDDEDVNPDASEACNGVDDDCNDLVDDQASDPGTWYRDADGDGVGDTLSVRFACDQPEGHVAAGGDCDDQRPEVVACLEGQRCSLARTCIEVDACSGVGDCPEEGTVCDLETLRCVPGSPCGGQAFDTARVASDLLVVLDRSCSMRSRVDGTRKWVAAVGAIGNITQAFADAIRFGLILFPDQGDDSRCGQGDIPIPIGDANGPAIRGLLQAALDSDDPNWPDGPCVTNIDSAIQQASTDPAFDDGRGHVLLVTDGQQSGCRLAGGNNGTLEEIAALLNRGVSTFVVGFGGEVSRRRLSEFAEAGGVPRAGDPVYYQADDEAALAVALEEIGRAVAGCVFELGEVPENDEALAVFFDDAERIPRDPEHVDGWDYDAETNTVTFHGAACDRIRDGEVVDVDIVFACRT